MRQMYRNATVIAKRLLVYVVLMCCRSMCTFRSKNDFFMNTQDSGSIEEIFFGLSFNYCAKFFGKPGQKNPEDNLSQTSEGNSPLYRLISSQKDAWRYDRPAIAKQV